MNKIYIIPSTPLYAIRWGKSMAPLSQTFNSSLFVIFLLSSTTNTIKRHQWQCLPNPLPMAGVVVCWADTVVHCQPRDCLLIIPSSSSHTPPSFADCCYTAQGLATINGVAVVTANGIVAVPHSSHIQFCWGRQWVWIVVVVVMFMLSLLPPPLAPPPSSSKNTRCCLPLHCYLVLPTFVWLVVVGTLDDGYIRKVPLPKIPWIQNTSHMTNLCVVAGQQDNCYREYPHVPTWRNLNRMIAGLGRSILVLYPGRWCRFWII